MATHSTPEQEGQCAHYVPLLVPVFWLKIGMWRWNRWREGRGGRRLGGRAAKLFQVQLPLRSCPEFRLRRFDLVKNPSGFQALVLLVLARHKGLLKVCLRWCSRTVKAPWHCSGCFLPPQWHTSTLILTGSRQRRQKWLTHQKQKAAEGQHHKPLHLHDSRWGNLRLRVGPGGLESAAAHPSKRWKRRMFGLPAATVTVLLKGKLGTLKQSKKSR